MIVDDLPSNRMLLEKIVRHRFVCDVITASNGKEVLEQLSLHTPDLILLDLLMPEMSGTELLKILHSKDEWKALPVIIISAEGDRSVVKEIASLGVSGYLLKPFSTQAVATPITDALKNSIK